MSRSQRQAIGLLLITVVVASFTATAVIAAVHSTPQNPVIPAVPPSGSPPETPTTQVLGIKVSCTSEVPVAEPVLCQMEANSTPNRSVWRAGGGEPENGVGVTFRTTFRTAGEKSVNLAVCVNNTCGMAAVAVHVISLPLVEVSCTPPSVPVSGEISCVASLTSATAESLEWRTSAGTEQTDGARFDTSFAAPGTQRIVVQACNLAGCGAAETSVDVIAPPLVKVSCTPAPVPVGGEISCAASLAGGTPESVEWTTSAGTQRTNQARFDASFAAPGTQRIVVRACNLAGCVAAETSVDVIAPPLVKVSCTSTPVTVGGEVYCKVSLAGGLPESIEWATSTGTGRTDLGVFVTSFAVPGEQSIVVEACNIAGCGRDLATVTIEAPSLLAISSKSVDFGAPCFYDFDNAFTCPTVVSRTIFVRNAGGGGISIDAVYFAGLAAPVGSDPTAISIASSAETFVVDPSDCVGRVLGGSTPRCVLVVTFAPDGAGTASGTLVIAHDGPNSPHLISVRGQGSPPPMSIQLFEASVQGGDCQVAGRMWVRIQFLVEGDPSGRIELWGRRQGTAFALIHQYFDIGNLRAVSPSQDDDEVWDYLLRATNSVGARVISSVRTIVGNDQCTVFE